MKIKKFDNIWTMGLILFFALLILFYVAKIIFPQFIVGVAEVPRIVTFGEWVDSHRWSYHLFELVWGILFYPLYICACCRMARLGLKDMGVMVLFLLFLVGISVFFPEYYFGVTTSCLVLCPFVICCMNGRLCKETFISLVFCFFVDNFSQILSMRIRDLTVMTTAVNTATFAILTIDVVIWRALLYCYFNKNKIKKEN